MSLDQMPTGSISEAEPKAVCPSAAAIVKVVMCDINKKKQHCYKLITNEVQF